MKATLTFDVAELRDYGSSTPSLRRLYVDWSEIDWFTAREAASSTRATRAFADHLSLGRAWLPERFPENVIVQTKVGTAADFRSLCERVRQATGWDWKYSALKPLSRKHSEACGWDQEQVDAGDMESGERPRVGDLWFRYQGRVMWNMASAHATIFPAGREWPEPGQVEAVDALAFYYSYAHFDLCEALTWQVAEGSADLATNPFVPLLRCYAEGYYPFSLGPGTVLLFAFA